MSNWNQYVFINGYDSGLAAINCKSVNYKLEITNFNIEFLRQIFMILWFQFSNFTLELWC